MVLHGSIGPKNLRSVNGWTIAYGDSAKNGVLSVHFNDPVKDGAIDSLTKQEFSICVDLKSIPRKLEWIVSQIALLKSDKDCHEALPEYCHHLLFASLCCQRYLDESLKYLTVFQIDDCKRLALEALPLMCLRYSVLSTDHVARPSANMPRVSLQHNAVNALVSNCSLMYWT